jgi:cytochrome b pre-mRNA-processing protein 3
MRKVGDAFYGRFASYDAALAAASPVDLIQALSRNVFSASRPDAAAERLARYVGEAVGQLDAREGAALRRGEIGFPDPYLTHAETV